MEFFPFLVTLLVVLRLFSLSATSFAVLHNDIIRPSDVLRDNHNDYTDTANLLVSKEGRFVLKFFSPYDLLNHRYLGIWYNHTTYIRPVWVANRCKPMEDSSGLLSIDNRGNLVLFSEENNSKREIVWSTNSSKQAAKPLVQLLDNGNLVLRDEKDANTTNYLWESFDYPTDTLLPGMKLGWDLKRGLNRRLSSWKSFYSDPCDGDFTYGIELDEKHHTYPQLTVRNGSAILYRQGLWDGMSSSDAVDDSIFNSVYNDDEVYYTYSLQNKSMMPQIVLNYDGTIEPSWDFGTFYGAIPRDKCDYYGFCGANSQCNVVSVTEEPICQCLEGFKPKNQDNWNSRSWSEGCEPYSPPSCHDEVEEEEGFEFDQYSGFRAPDTNYSWVTKTKDESECRSKCLSNCSCMAYSYPFSESIYSNEDSPKIHNETRADGSRGKVKVKRAVIIIAIVVGLGGVFILIAFYIRRRRRIFERKESQYDDFELPFLDLHTISLATKNFAEANKLGEGGFGPVYKGTMEGGQEIAVKRLSMCSGQGVNEFKNEINLIAKIQHRNLVKIFGYCIHREMKLLIYEYMSNKSLDYFIFDERQSILLEWPKRYKIVSGIAKGLLYLHHDSRLRIIHRDLKASNVLLDEEMNPKISDFGLARTFGGDQLEGNTNKVVGTYGYMAPEYASNGLFSIKSDVFSFGTLVLEIVSGKKSRGLYDEDKILNLTGLAWTLMKEGHAFKLIEKCLLSDPYINMEEALRCIHIGLLCVQQNPNDRPNMSSIILMLSGEKMLPQPKPPAYFTNTDMWEEAHSSVLKPPSCNTSITAVDGR
uniref:Receptor-like serine/threonine-protein kinase n=1 Tax=Cannabis sativa TaxID=3483 RepID=A0A803PZS2_CANSA